MLPSHRLLYSSSRGADEDRVELQRLRSPGVAAVPSGSVRSPLRLYIPARSARRAGEGRSARERRRWRRLRKGGKWREGEGMRGGVRASRLGHRVSSFWENISYAKLEQTHCISSGPCAASPPVMDLVSKPESEKETTVSNGCCENWEPGITV